MIGVIGVGSYGTSLAKVLALNSPKALVYVWDHDDKVLDFIEKENVNSVYLPNIKLPTNIIPVKTLEELIKKVDDLLITVPSKFFAQLIDNIQPLLNKHRIIWGTKGLDNKTIKLFHQIIEEKLGKEQIYGVISGPSFAAEIAKEMPTSIDIASTNDLFLKDLYNYFNSKTFKVYKTDDVIGLQVGSIIKNIIALACGISDGLGFGANTKAAIMTKGILEMFKLGTAIGAKQETLMGLAGLGDVILTATDNQSRNRRMGLCLSQGKTIDEAAKEIGQAVESISNCEAICKLANKYKVNLTLITKMKEILQLEKIDPSLIQNLI